jgi:hypothetical protein
VFPINASEWSVLNDDERFQLNKVLVEQNAGRLPVVIGVQASAAENAARLAAHARRSAKTPMPIDDIASKYLDQIVKDLKPLNWKKQKS